MFLESAELYDLIYDEIKDYEAEAKRLAELIRELRPEARAVLDAGCGTGRHASLLGDVHGFQVDGLDLAPAFVEVASRRCPGGTFVQADMADFTLGRRYDVVVSLFGSVGYLRTLERLVSAFRTFRSHLDKDGLLLVEPWLGPDDFTGPRTHLTCARGDDVQVARAARSDVAGRTSVLDFQYLVVKPDGVEHRREVHELGLFTPDEMTEAFRTAGLEMLRHDPEGLNGRGLYVATR